VIFSCTWPLAPQFWSPFHVTERSIDWSFSFLVTWQMKK
jgi:hypothetical protein